MGLLTLGPNVFAVEKLFIRQGPCVDAAGGNFQWFDGSVMPQFVSEVGLVNGLVWGKIFTGNHRFSHEVWGVQPSIFPTPIHWFISWITKIFMALTRVYVLHGVPKPIYDWVGSTSSPRQFRLWSEICEISSKGFFRSGCWVWGKNIKLGFNAWETPGNISHPRGATSPKGWSNQIMGCRNIRIHIQAV